MHARQQSLRSLLRVSLQRTCPIDFRISFMAPSQIGVASDCCMAFCQPISMEGMRLGCICRMNGGPLLGFPTAAPNTDCKESVGRLEWSALCGITRNSSFNRLCNSNGFREPSSFLRLSFIAVLTSVLTGRLSSGVSGLSCSPSQCANQSWSNAFSRFPNTPDQIGFEHSPKRWPFPWKRQRSSANLLCMRAD